MTPTPELVAAAIQLATGKIDPMSRALLAEHERAERLLKTLNEQEATDGRVYQDAARWRAWWNAVLEKDDTASREIVNRWADRLIAEQEKGEAT